MKKIFILASLIVSNWIPNSAQAHQFDCCPCREGWYGVVSAGYAWSRNTTIKADPRSWDAATEGYNDNLGNSPFFTIGFGKSFCDLLYIDLDYSYYQTFHYQRHQTGISATPGFSGATRTRYFDLDHQNVLVNFTFRGDCFSFNVCNGRFLPFVGAGVGVGINRVSNFHTVAGAPVIFDGIPLGFSGSTTSIGDPRTRSSIAWQATAGIEFSPSLCSPLSFDIGYHYYDGGRFRGPSRVVINTTETFGGSLSVIPWEGRLKAHELFVALNYKI